MKKIVRKSLSLLLALTLVCSLPISALADSETDPAPTVEKVEIDFTGENVPSVTVDVTPGTSNTGSVDASEVAEETAEKVVEEMEANLPEAGFVDNGDGTHSVVSNSPIYDGEGNIIGYNTTTTTVTNDNKVISTTESETVQAEDADREASASMSEITNNGSGDPADWEMESVVPTVTPDAKNYVDEENDLRIISDPSAEYNGPLEDLDWETHAFAYIKPALGSQICVDLIADPTALPFEGPGIYELQNEAGEKFYAYCVDEAVLAAPGSSYDMLNVEDAEYFSDEDARHIRYIAENGYWGVAPQTDEDGNVIVESGSLEAMKDMMRNATDENGNPVFSSDEVDLLTDGLALSVTQAAIWYYGNSGKDSCKVDADNIIGSGAVFTGRYYGSIRVSNKTEEVLAYEEANNKTLGSAPEASKVSDETIGMAQKLFEFMLEGESEATDDTTAMTDSNAITSAEVTVNNQVTDDLSLLNNSATKTYNVDVAFTLGVVPGNGDRLVVEVYQLDAEGNVVMDGSEPVVLSSVEVQTGETDYTIKGLELPNGSTITLNMSGVNKLEKGVYLYSAVDFRDSQTMIGYAEGNQAVDLSVNLSFEADEPELSKEHSVKTNVRVQPNPPITPPGNTPPSDPPSDPPTENPPTDPPTDIPPEDPPLTEIPDEEPPLANVPKTGDGSAVWFVLAALLAVALSAVIVIEKKRQTV